MSKPDDPVPNGLAKAGPVAEHLGTDVDHLAKWRYENRGPKYIKMGRSVRYRWSDVFEWVERNARDTSESA